MKPNIKRKLKRGACLFIPIGFLATTTTWYFKLIAVVWLIFAVECLLEALCEYEWHIEDASNRLDRLSKKIQSTNESDE